MRRVTDVLHSSSADLDSGLYTPRHGRSLFNIFVSISQLEDTTGHQLTSLTKAGLGRCSSPWTLP